MDITHIIKEMQQAFEYIERVNHEAVWRDISRYILLENAGNFQGTNTPGSRKTTGLFDTSGIQANKDLAASLHGTLTNPATKWFALRYKDELQNNDSTATAWLQESVDMMLDHLNRSNFYTEMAKAYGQYSALGNLVLFQEEDFGKDDKGFEGFYFKAIHLSEVAFSENYKGEVDKIFRKFKLTPRQILEKFPEAPSFWLEKLATHSEERFEILHCIYPRTNLADSEMSVDLKGPKDRAFASVYIDLTYKTVLQESGYYEFPLFVSRWSLAPMEIYGTAPGHLALPDVKTLNKLIQLDLEARTKTINPPYLTLERNMMGNLDLRPGSINVVRNLEGLRPLDTKTNFTDTNDTVARLKDQINKVFFLDKLALPPREDTGAMTAYEVSQRIEQMQRVLGAVLGRLTTEVLTPLIYRTFKILYRNGALPKLPDSLKKSGVDVDIVFTNQLSRSQRMQDVSAIQAWIQDLTVLFQLKPEIADYINGDEITKLVADIGGVPAKAVTDDGEVQQIRQQRAQQMAQQQAQEAAVAQADVNSKNAKAQRPGGGNSTGLTPGAPVNAIGPQGI